MSERDQQIQDFIAFAFDLLLRYAPPFARAMPQRVLHYTTEPGLRAILRSQVLHLPSQPWDDGEGDQKEINWGRAEIIDEARTFLAEAPFPALRRMLEEPNATLFGRERSAFMACFTTEDHQWSRRQVDAALVFDAVPLNLHHRVSSAGHGLAAVSYGELAVRRPVTAFLRAARDAVAPLGPMSDHEEHLAAQCLMDFDVLSFFAKAQSFDWESEWRLVKREWTTAPLQKQDPRRIELSLADTQCGLTRIVLKPGSSDDLRADVQAMASLLPYSVPVTPG